MSGIGIITNPHSKLNKRNPARKALLGYILGTQGTLEVTESIDDLSRVAREFRAKEIETLAINGGDGTISRTLTAFITEYGAIPLPKIVLLRGGTINVLANNLGVKGSPESILYRLTQHYSQGATEEVTSIDVSSLQVDGIYGFLFANGAPPAFLKEYYQHKSGPLGAAWWVIRVWCSRFLGGRLYRSVMSDTFQTLTATPDKRRIGHRSCAVFCSTLPKLPLGYPLFKKMKGYPSSFECVSFTFAAKDAVWSLPATLMRPKDDPRRRLSFVAESLTLETEKPLEYTLDGELFAPSESKVTVKLGPRLTFLVV